MGIFSFHKVAEEIDGRNQLEILMDEKDVIYVFDRGSMDFERFDELCQEGYTFLTRIKKNTVVTEVETSRRKFKAC